MNTNTETVCVKSCRKAFAATNTARAWLENARADVPVELREELREVIRASGRMQEKINALLTRLEGGAK